MPKLKQKQLPKFQNPKLYPRKIRRKLNRQNPNQKTLMMRAKKSIVPDLAGTLQTREISVEISLWNRGEERADEDGSSGDGGKDWRIDIYKENSDGMGGSTKIFIQAWKQIGKGEIINTGFYLKFEDQSSQQRLEENKMINSFRGTQEEKKAYQEMLKEELEEGIVISIQQDQVKWWNHTFLIKKPNGSIPMLSCLLRINDTIGTDPMEHGEGFWM
ncbi:MAG: hypothetical protein EZS28_025154 [Streblomastix strix]|uniref:Uncharacterized protein n=1 Tax=Streblomastix strix TaxID=222440 RepID=A0A5J4V9W7_9EUKA|nr:MAG: hypothetical protein EZS28_025154 [Streblomastix strix]